LYNILIIKLNRLKKLRNYHRSQIVDNSVDFFVDWVKTQCYQISPTANTLTYCT
jgi:hypothetical protein